MRLFPVRRKMIARSISRPCEMAFVRAQNWYDLDSSILVPSVQKEEGQ